MKKTKLKKDVAVLYHADCPDGFGAAWAAWKKFKGRALYIPVHHNGLPPSEIEGRNVYTVDFAYPVPEMKKILKKVKSLTVIDHHVTNKDSVKLATNRLFDLKHSGATLSWMYFHKGKRIPKLLLHIEDMDLWNFKMRFTKEFVEYICSYPFEFRLWDKIAVGCENPHIFKTYILEGGAILRSMYNDIKKIVQNAEFVKFEGYKCLMANAGLHTSYVGHELVKQCPPIGIIWSRRGDKIVVSLRSNGKVDVAKLAQKYGGGGHKAASGFSFNVKHFLKFKGGKIL